MVLRPGFEETEENLTNLMESRLQDHERIRGGLYFVESIPRDENWKVRRDVLLAFEPKQPEDCTLNVSAALPSSSSASGNLAEQVSDSPKLAKKMVKELPKQPNGAFVASTETPRLHRSGLTKKPLEDVPRRGSMDCILEDSISGAAAAGGVGVLTPLLPGKGQGSSSRRCSRLPSSGSRGSSRRGSTDLQDCAGSEQTFQYWLQVTVVPQVRLF